MKNQNNLSTDGYAYQPIEQLIPNNWTQSFINANGIDQHFIRAGFPGKQPLILYHGFVESSLSWLRVAKRLQANYDIVMPDARYHGKTQGNAVDLSPELLIEDLVALIEALDLVNPVLIGSSMGAVVSTLAADKFPDIVKAVVLEEPHSRGTARLPAHGKDLLAKHGFRKTVLWIESLKEMSFYDRLESAIGRWPAGLPLMEDEPLWTEDEFIPYLESLARFDTGVYKHKISYFSFVQHMEQIESLACPVLYLTGNHLHGSLSDPKIVDHLVANWSNCHHEYYEEGGHFLSRGKTHEKYIHHISQFLGDITGI